MRRNENGRTRSIRPILLIVLLLGAEFVAVAPVAASRWDGFDPLPSIGPVGFAATTADDPPTAVDVLRLALGTTARPYHSQAAGAPIEDWMLAYAWHEAALDNPVQDPGFEVGFGWALGPDATIAEGRLALGPGAFARQAFAALVPSTLDPEGRANGFEATGRVMTPAVVAFRASGPGEVDIGLVDRNGGFPFQTVPVAFSAGTVVLPVEAFRPTRADDPAATPDQAVLVDLTFRATSASVHIDDVVIRPSPIASALVRGSMPDDFAVPGGLGGTLGPAHDGRAVLLMPLPGGGFLGALVEYAPSGARLLPLDAAASWLRGESASGATLVNLTAPEPRDSLGTAYGGLFAEARLVGDFGFFPVSPAAATGVRRWVAEFAPASDALDPSPARGHLHLGKLIDPGNPANDALDLVPDVAAEGLGPLLFADTDADGYTDPIEVSTGASPRDKVDTPGRDPAGPALLADVPPRLRHVAAIRHPLATLPAFVAPEGKLSVELVSSARPTNVVLRLTLSNTGLADAPALEWSGSAVEVGTAYRSDRWGDMPTPAWRLNVTLPDGVDASLLDRTYDLRVDWTDTQPRTDRQPRSVRLVADGERAPITAFISAPRITNGTEALDAIVDELNLRGPDLVAVLGDVAHRDADAAQAYALAYDALLRLEAPVVLVPGETDGIVDATNDRRDLWAAAFGPRWYTLDVPGGRLIGLDTFDWGRTDRTPVPGVPNLTGAQMRIAQFEWLQAELTRVADAPTVVLGHHSPAVGPDAAQRFDEDAAVTPASVSGSFLAGLITLLGTNLSPPADIATRAAAASVDASAQHWTGARRLDLRDAFRTANVVGYHSGHDEVDILRVEQADRIVALADGRSLVEVDRAGKSVGAADASQFSAAEGRIAYIGTVGLATGAAREYAGYRWQPLDGVQGYRFANQTTLEATVATPAEWSLEHAQLGLYSVPAGRLALQASAGPKVGEWTLAASNLLDEPATLAQSLAFTRPGVDAGIPVVRPLREADAAMPQVSVADDITRGVVRELSVVTSLEPGGRTDAIVYLDHVAPTSALAALPVFTNGTVRLTLATLVDDHDITDLQVQAFGPDAASWENVTCVLAGVGATCDLRFEQDGAYAFRSLATDLAGRSEPDAKEADARTMLDTNAPTATLTRVGAAVVSATQAGFMLSFVGATASETPRADIYARARTATTADFTEWVRVAENVSEGAWTFEAPESALYELEAIGHDAAGNFETPHKVAETIVLLDVDAPIVNDLTIGVPENGEPFRLNFSSVDALSAINVDAEVDYDGERCGTCTVELVDDEWRIELDVPATSARLTYVFVARDAAGNERRATAELDIADPIAPVVEVIEIASSPVGTGEESEIVVRVTDNRGVPAFNASAERADGTPIENTVVARSETERVVTLRAPLDSIDGFLLTLTATDAAGNPTEVARTLDVKDVVRPASVLTLPAGYWHTAAITLQATATDNVRLDHVEFYARRNVGNDSSVAWRLVGRDSSAPFTATFLPTGEGNHDFATVAVDAAGNRELLPSLGQTAGFDLVAPTLRVLSPDDSAYFTAPPSVRAALQAGPAGATLHARTLGADGAPIHTATASLTSVGGEQTLAPGGILPETLNDGAFRYQLLITDSLGRESSLEERAFFIDTQAPFLTLTVPTRSNTTQVALVVSVEDASPTTVRLERKAPGATQWSPVAEIAGGGTFRDVLPEGAFVYRAVAFDAAGNLAISAERGVVVDTTLPEVRLLSPARAYARDGNYAFHALASDLGGLAAFDVALLRDDGVWTNRSSVTGELKVEAPFLTTTRRLDVFVSATDTAGNRRTTNHIIDVVAPKVDARLGLVGTRGVNDWFVSPVNVSVQPMGPDAALAVPRHAVALEGAAMPALQDGATFRLAESGIYRVAFAADPDRSLPPAVQTVRLDLEAPAVRLMSPVGAIPAGRLVDFVVDATDLTSGVIGASVQAGGRAAALERGADGLWRARLGPFETATTMDVVVSATDAAGHTALATMPMAVGDGVPPTVTLDIPTGTLSGLVDVSARATDDQGAPVVWFEVDGATVGSLASTLSWDTRPLSNGAHTVAAVARDGAGNLARDERTLRIENAPALGEPRMELVDTAPDGSAGALVLALDVGAPGGRIAAVEALIETPEGTPTRLTLVPAVCDAPCATRTYEGRIAGPWAPGSALAASFRVVDGALEATAPADGPARIEVAIPRAAPLAEWRAAASGRMSADDSGVAEHAYVDILDAQYHVAARSSTFGLSVASPFDTSAPAFYYVEFHKAPGAPAYRAFNLTYVPTAGTPVWTLRAMDLENGTITTPSWTSAEIRTSEFAITASTRDLVAFLGGAGPDLQVRFRAVGSSDETTQKSIDLVPPVITHTAPGTLGRGKVATLAATIKDASPIAVARLLYTVDGGPVRSASVDSGFVTLPALEGAQLRYHLVARDVHGNEARTASFLVSLVDSTPPVARLVLTAGDAKVPVGTRLTFSAALSTDDVGVTTTSWRFSDAATFAFGATEATHKFDALGVHTVTVKVHDAAGNAAIAALDITVYDDTPPTSRITSPSGVYITPGARTIIIEASADATAVDVSLGDGAWRPAARVGGTQWSYAWNAAPGAHLLATRARDADGLVETPAAPLRVVAHDTPPAVSLSAHVEGAAPDARIRFSLAVAGDVPVTNATWDFGDGTRLWCAAATVLGGPDTVCTQSAATTTPHPFAPTHAVAWPGDHRVRVTVRDDAGLESVARLVISVPSYAPPAAPPRADETPPTMTMTWAPAAPGERVTFTAPTVGFTPTRWTWAFGDGATASGRVVEHAFDEAGNFTVRVTIDGPSALRRVAQGSLAVAAPSVAAPAPHEGESVTPLVEAALGVPLNGAVVRSNDGALATTDARLAILATPDGTLVWLRGTTRAALEDGGSWPRVAAGIVEGNGRVVAVGPGWHAVTLDRPSPQATFASVTGPQGALPVAQSHAVPGAPAGFVFFAERAGDAFEVQWSLPAGVKLVSDVQGRAEPVPSPYVLTFGATAGATARWRIVGQTDWTEGAAATLTGEGPVTLEYQGVDGAGNADEVRTASFVLDARSPTLASVGVRLDLATSRVLVDVALVEEHPESLLVRLTRPDGTRESWAPEPGALTTMAHVAPFAYEAEGVHTFEVRATDAAGRTSTRILTFDVKLPVVVPVAETPLEPASLPAADARAPTPAAGWLAVVGAFAAAVLLARRPKR